ncbi:MAG: FecR family protein [Woeseiaceae bacterium]|nr:FecR family protein [Woeseiaceae bacterium]
MTEKRRRDRRSLDNEQTVAELLRMAGPRPEIDTERRRRVYASVLEAWQERDGSAATGRAYGPVLRAWRRATARPRHLRWIVPMAAAAALVLAINLRGPDAPRPVAVASVSKIVGAGPSGWHAGDEIVAGTTLVTGPDDGLGITLATGQSLRIDANTRVTLVARDRIVLDAGRVYADTGDFVYRDAGLLVDTPLGSVRDVGTQFTVALPGETLDVAVREGRVDVAVATSEHIAVAGERLFVGSDGSASREEIAPTAAFWDWATGLAPDFDIENRSLLDFLKWVARETGMELVFGSTDARLAAMRTDLHGSIANLSPLEALDSVVATTAFSYRIEGNRIVLER